MITQYYDMYSENKMELRELYNAIVSTTGVRHSHRLQELMCTEHKLSLRKILCAAVRDMRDEHLNPRPRILPSTKGQRVVVPCHGCCGARITSTNSSSSVTSGSIMGNQSRGELTGLPNDETRVKLRDTLTFRLPFPKVPTTEVSDDCSVPSKTLSSQDCRFVKNVALGYANGWISQHHLKSLLDVWEVELTPSVSIIVLMRRYN